ncbi:C6 transcription factor [Colletotrichum truncatum]|uniref:C6 transcription factor n=1 Tax=Colletotrichum truncatum TaxID=5467 RepID=A0ACC3YY12_COLTU|nr:C6 transcription factor [Colletotrichum truncatum]KAF6790831.1 C6 transcription factor [Colletotrichum truncatum]
MGDDRQLHLNGDGRRHSEPNFKRRRITKACDFCHRRGRKCKPVPEGSGVETIVGHDGQPSCLTCIEHNAECTWNRVAAKRGVKSKTSPASIKQPQHRDVTDRWFYDESRHGSRNLVHRLICIFFDTVYPVFPFYDEPSLMKEWETSNMSSNRVAFARLMAICALSASHVRDGALFTPDVPEMIRDELQQTYMDDARKAIPDDNRDIPKHEVFAYLQVLGTMSLAAIQIKDDPLFEQYLGRYHNIVAQSVFQFETNWGDLTSKEVYVRRQFFWSMYRLEVHSALIQGHVIRCPELQCGVSYPVHVGLSGVLDPTGVPVPENPGDPKPDIFFPGSWLVGWNYITDLYRVLEHVIVRMRIGRVQAVHRDRTHLNEFLPSIDALLEKVLERKSKLPVYASQAFPSSDNREENLCGFQVANIACTYQLLRMAAFACDNQFEKACGAAIELINEITQVPTVYLRAIGHPMLQELVGVGHLLSSFIGRHLSTYQYHKLREVMHAMAVFLQNLGSSVPNAPQISGKLFQYISNIDEELNKRIQQQPITMTDMLPTEIPGGPQVIDVMPPGTMDQYQVQDAPLYNISMNFMNNVFSTAFNDATEIDWRYALENWTT